MNKDNDKDKDLSQHILPNSATMVGVCIMVISIVKTSDGAAHHIVDKALAINSVLFMTSALLSFLSIRMNRSTVTLEWLAEIIFLIALFSMALITVIFAFEFV
ncbi:MAG: hypothetical protein ABL885_11690 [Methylophilaceae bacterium]